MEASMTDVAAPSSFYLDLQIPSILRRRGGRVCPSPTPVPELAPNATPEARHRGQEGRDLDGEAAQLFQASAEPGVIERDELRTELVDLKSQISALRLERDELLAAAVSLNGEVSDLQSKQQELIFLRSEIQALRTRKSLLERPITSLRRPTERIRWGRTEFHDS
jgi:chromosome segregation ATPase